MNSAEKEDKLARSKVAQKMRAMIGKDQALLERLTETRAKCGDGVKMLPVVHYERKLWFFDERLRQLRNLWNPHDFINLNDFEVEYFKRKVV
jgi:hypothetical protein